MSRCINKLLLMIMVVIRVFFVQRLNVIWLPSVFVRIVVWPVVAELPVPEVTALAISLLASEVETENWLFTDEGVARSQGSNGVALPG